MRIPAKLSEYVGLGTRFCLDRAPERLCRETEITLQKVFADQIWALSACKETHSGPSRAEGVVPTRGHFTDCRKATDLGQENHMGNKQARRRVSARRAAALLAALGALVMSSGIALMVAATPANATQAQHVPVGVCHATSSDTNPYVFIVVDDDSTKLKGHLMHRNDPNKTWKSAGTYVLGGSHAAGDPKRDYIASYTGTDGVFHQLDGAITAASCPAGGEEETPPAWADVDFNNPTCALPNSGSIDTSGSEGVTFQISPDKESYSIGDDVTVHAVAGEVDFAKDADVTWTHHFVASDAPCDQVSAPITASVSFTEPTCASPTAGYTGTNTAKVKYAVTSGSVAPGATVTVTASAIGEDTISGQTEFKHTFAGAPANCSQVSPPQTESQVVVKTPKTKTKSKAESAVTPTVVEAGLVGTSAQDLRGEQGLALMVAGMVMLVGAGGLGLRVRRAAARS